MDNKQHLRIALLGLSPADQITIKGYMRVLLRLDVLLEWVAASDQGVHLFFVNDQFKNASSVTKVLQSSPDARVLYVNHDMGYEGGLVGDNLGLPLKNIELLDKWLRQRLPMLAGSTPYHAPATTGIAPSAASDFVNTPSTLQNNQYAQPSAPSAPRPSPITAQSLSQSDLTGLVKIIKTIALRESGTFALKDDVRTYAIIEPKRQKVWVQAQGVRLTQARLEPTTPTTGAGDDLVTYLFDNALDDPELGTAMVRLLKESKYKIRYWVRPSKPSHLREVMAVMTALEREARDGFEVSQIAGVDATRTQEIIAALLVAGALTRPTYEVLQAPVVQSSQPTPRIAPTPPPAPQAPPQPAVQAQNEEKLGFLARLRRKLGLG